VSSGTASRRRGREAALQLLYQVEFSGDSSPRAFEEFWRSRSPKQQAERPFAETLARRVLDRKVEIDALIDRASDNWQLERFARMDLNLLRIGVCELLGPDGLPAEIVVNEAIEVAKKYCDAGSPAFVNGVLDRVARELKPSTPD
jgi:N utilization substance protein B